MRSVAFRILPAIAASCLLYPLASPAQTAAADTPLVRLSFVQGDVRLSTGNGNQADLSKKWEQAESDLVIQPGYSFATGDGRAEIEFENGSWVWLGENSALIVQDLHTKGGSNVVSLMLMSGIGSFFVNRGPSDTFDIKTPVNEISLEDSAFIRVNSFLDGTLVTDLQNAKGNGVPDPSAEKGATFALPGSSFVTPDALTSANPPADWDSWVSSRLQHNQAAMSAALKLSGLTAPIPGLEDLPQDGSFFPCAPYGICWDSNVAAMEAQVATPAGSSPQAGTNTTAGPTASNSAPNKKLTSTILISLCPRIWRTTWYDPDPKHPGKTITRMTDAVENSGFVTCHAGSYIRYHKHYVWVAGKRRRHPPVHWVKVGDKVNFVPRHPNDTKGKQPINLKYGVFVPPKKSGEPMQSIKVDPKKQVTVLGSPPKKFAGDPVTSLRKVSSPQIEAHLLAGAGPHAAGGLPETVRPGIPYDYKTGQFIRPGTTIGKVTVKPTPIGGLTVGKPAPARSGGQPSNNGGVFARGGGSSNSGGNRSYSGGNFSRGSEQVRSSSPPSPPESRPAPPPPPAASGRPH
jgi:hypothetical protein